MSVDNLPRKSDCSSADFMQEAVDNNLYLLGFKQNRNEGMSYGEAVKELFVERGRILSLPERESRERGIESVTEAITIVNIPLVLNATTDALRKIYNFYSTHWLPNPNLDINEGFSIALKTLVNCIEAYDPAEGGFYGYTYMALMQSVFRDIVLPGQVNISDGLKDFIFFNEAQVIYELCHDGHDGNINQKMIEDALVKKFSQTAFGQSTPFITDNLRLAYRAMCTPMESLDKRAASRRMQDYRIARKGGQDDLDGGRYPEVMIVTEPEGNADPQNREALLFDEFDPTDEAWQKRVLGMLEDIGAFRVLNEREEQVLVGSLTVVDEGKNAGKFYNHREIGEMLGISSQRVIQLLQRIYSKLGVNPD